MTWKASPDTANTKQHFLLCANCYPRVLEGENPVKSWSQGRFLSRKCGFSYKLHSINYLLTEIIWKLKKKLTKNQQAIRVTLKTMNCVNNERSKCPWTALTCLYLAEALAGVSVGLINTFLGPKSPCCSQTRSDTRVGASRSCCAFRALVNPGLICFLGQQLLTLPCLQQWQPWCHQDLPDVYRASGAPGQDKQHPVALLDLCLCSSSSASSAGGNFSSGCPRRILVTEQEHKVCSTGVGAFRKMRKGSKVQMNSELFLLTNPLLISHFAARSGEGLDFWCWLCCHLGAGSPLIHFGPCCRILL